MFAAQDQDVTKHLEELRATKPPRDVQAEQRQLLATLTQRLDESPDDPAQQANLYHQAKAELVLALACNPADQERDHIQTALARLDAPRKYQ